MGRALHSLLFVLVTVASGCSQVETPSPPTLPAVATVTPPAPAAPPAARAPSAEESTVGLEDGALPTWAGSSEGRVLAWLPEARGVYEILATEVTVAQFRGCVNAGGCESSTYRDSCNFGQAGRGDHPMNCVDWHGADAFCRWAGGRLCTEPEWLQACAGANDRAYPYGDAYALAACNHQSTSAQVDGRAMGTVAAGSLDTCQGGIDGLYDMAGNVAEWVDACKGTYCKFRGAGWRSNDPIARFAGCRGVCSGNQKTFASGTIGFRCCRDRP